MTNWFPLAASRVEDPVCQKLTPRERIYLEYVISEYSRRGPFYQSDLEVAVTLGMSEVKVRQARRKVGIEPDRVRQFAAMLRGVEVSRGYGWIVYEHGWKRGARGQATKYLHVPIAEHKAGDWFAFVPRYTFEMLLVALRARVLSHADIVVWLVLAYKYWRCRGKEADHSFFVTKHELGLLSGVTSAVDSVHRLHGTCETGDEDGQRRHLFYLSDHCRRLTFRNWTWYADPSESETNLEIQQQARDSIAATVARIRAIKATGSAAKGKRGRIRPRSARS